MKAVAVGVDIGTTSTKAFVFDRGGQEIAGRSTEYPLHTPEPDAAEQDPDEIFNAVVAAISGAIGAAGAAPSDILCVSFSAAMHSILAVDEEGAPLMRAMTFADNRSLRQAYEIGEEFAGHDIYLRTGTPIHPMAPLAKLRWMQAARKEVFERAARFVSIKEYVLYKLFGRYVVDHSMASATGLFDIRRLEWDGAALSVAGVAPDRLSTLEPPTHVLSGLERPVARRLGVSADTPFVIGASDGALANLGVGAISSQTMAATIGTSGAVRAVVRAPMTDAQGRTFCYVLADGRWVIGGPINNGGIVLRWMRDELGTEEIERAHRLEKDPYDIILDIAAGVPPGCEGLLFLPYLAGERAPHWDPDARGVLFGLSLKHRKAHLFRAALEGVVLSLHSVARVLEGLGGPASEVRATGGFTRSALWLQIMADVFDREIVVPEGPESSCLGAALLGMVAVKEVETLDAVTDMVPAAQRVHPDPEATRAYARLIPIFDSIFTGLKSGFGDIASFQRGIDENERETT